MCGIIYVEVKTLLAKEERITTMTGITKLSDIIVTDYIVTDTIFHGHNYSRYVR